MIRNIISKAVLHKCVKDYFLKAWLNIYACNKWPGNVSITDQPKAPISIDRPYITQAKALKQEVWE